MNGWLLYKSGDLSDKCYFKGKQNRYLGGQRGEIGEELRWELEGFRMKKIKEERIGKENQNRWCVVVGSIFRMSYRFRIIFRNLGGWFWLRFLEMRYIEFEKVVIYYNQVKFLVKEYRY